MNSILQGIYQGSAHGLYAPAKELPVLSHLVTNYYSLGVVNIAFKQNAFSIPIKATVSLGMTLASYAICKLADDKRVTTFILHIPAVIVSACACKAGGTFGAVALLTMQANSLLEFWPDQTACKVMRVTLFHFSTLMCGHILEKVVVIARFLLFLLAGPEKGQKIIMGNLLEAGQTLLEII